MVSIKALLLSNALLSAPALVAAQCPGGLYGLAGGLLSKYPPAQTYCSSKFPIPPKTITLSYSTTVTTTYSTSTVTTTVGTATATYDDLLLDLINCSSLTII